MIASKLLICCKKKIILEKLTKLKDIIELYPLEQLILRKHVYENLIETPRLKQLLFGIRHHLSLSLRVYMTIGVERIIIAIKCIYFFV